MRVSKGVIYMKTLNCCQKDECEIIADEIMAKLHNVCNRTQTPIEELIGIGIDIFTDTIKNS